MSHLYLSGPMTAAEDPRAGCLRFAFAASLLQRRGHEVTNPTEDTAGPVTSWSDGMRRDVEALLRVDAVVVLAPWRDARYVGVQVEAVLAATLGLPIYEFDPESTRGYGPRLLSHLATARERAAYLLAGSHLPATDEGQSL